MIVRLNVWNNFANLFQGFRRDEAIRGFKQPFIMQFAVKETHGSEKPPFPICDIIELVIVGRGHKTFRSILPAKNKVMQMMCSSKCMPAIRIYQLALSFAKRRIEFGNIRYFCCNSF